MGIVVPIVKKGEGRTVEEYRGVTLLDTAYKVYVGVLERKLERKMEKEMVPENQTGFTRNMGTMENIYVVNYIVKRELAKRGGKMWACFLDIKAAFDSLNRGKLWEIMERRGVNRTLRERIREVYVETENRVRVGMECGNSFWKARGVRQGCPLSAKLFILYMADLEEVLRRRGKGGVEAVLGRARLYSLQYADDVVVLLVREESGMRLMIGEVKKYLEEKQLKVSVGKTKIIRFGIGKGEKERWMWEGREIEKVDEFKYLGYIFRKNGGQEGQIRDRERQQER